jgi:hypothetical protein
VTNPMPTVWQENAAAFAATPETHIDQERRAGVRRAAELIAAGEPGRAQYVLARSVMRQNRIAGGGTVEIHPACPCPGRCARGGSL